MKIFSLTIVSFCVNLGFCEEVKPLEVFQRKDKMAWEKKLSKLSLSPWQARRKLTEVLNVLIAAGKIGYGPGMYRPCGFAEAGIIVGDSYLVSIEKFGIDFEGFYVAGDTGVVEYRRCDFHPKNFMPKSINGAIYTSIEKLSLRKGGGVDIDRRKINPQKK
jgi:hypothetical protein